jgi:hypothetical protein
LALSAFLFVRSLVRFRFGDVVDDQIFDLPGAFLQLQPKLRLQRTGKGGAAEITMGRGIGRRPISLGQEFQREIPSPLEAGAIDDGVHPTSTQHATETSEERAGL